MTRRERTLLCQRAYVSGRRCLWSSRKILPKCARWQPKTGALPILGATLWFTAALTQQAAADGNSQLQPKF